MNLYIYIYIIGTTSKSDKHIIAASISLVNIMMHCTAILNSLFKFESSFCKSFWQSLRSRSTRQQKLDNWAIISTITNWCSMEKMGAIDHYLPLVEISKLRYITLKRHGIIFPNLFTLECQIYHFFVSNAMLVWIPWYCIVSSKTLRYIILREIWVA